MESIGAFIYVSSEAFNLRLYLTSNSFEQRFEIFRTLQWNFKKSVDVFVLMNL